MIYIKAFENFNIIDTLKENVPFDQFKNHIMSLSDIDKKTIMDYINEVNNKGIILYHGTPKHKEIEDEGLKLTKGLREFGFLGGVTYHVQNLGIYLSDSKNTAGVFGRNRSEYHNKPYKVIEYVADIHNILDFNSKIPYKIHKLGSKLINDYEGGKRNKIAGSSVFWCLDQKQFVDYIKSQGYDAVKFKEDPDAPKGAKKSNTYFVMDIEKLHRKIITFQDLYNHLVFGF